MRADLTERFRWNYIGLSLKEDVDVGLRYPIVIHARRQASRSLRIGGFGNSAIGKRGPGLSECRARSSAGPERNYDGIRHAGRDASRVRIHRRPE